MVVDASNSFSPAGDDWEPARMFLVRILNQESTIGLIAKALLVRSGFEKSFCEATIFTDLRPVFRSVDDPPAAFLTMHSLRITYHHGEGHDREEAYIALSKNDLDQLSKIIERAQSKEAQLRKVVDRANALFLEAKS